MASRKSLRPAEWLLFLTPLVMLGIGLLAQPLHQKLFPLPTPTSVPLPTLAPISNLWKGYSDLAPLVPSRDGKFIYTAGYVMRALATYNAHFPLPKLWISRI